MTRWELLDQYRDILREIDTLQADIVTGRQAHARAEQLGPDLALLMNPVLVASGSLRIQALMGERLAMREQERDAAEALLDSVRDPVMIQRLTLHFVRGHSWDTVANRTSGEDGELLRRRCRRYVSKLRIK